MPAVGGAAAEGTATLFETDYFGEKAYLSQSGQLYLEPAAAAFGKVYCFGPTFRAEKSKTRRHLTEFWMVEPEVAFMDLDGDMELMEQFVSHVVRTALARHREELRTVLERDVSALERVKPAADLVAQQLAFAGGRIPIYPGIGAFELETDAALTQLQATRAANTRGFVVFVANSRKTSGSSYKPYTFATTSTWRQIPIASIWPACRWAMPTAFPLLSGSMPIVTIRLTPASRARATRSPRSMSRVRPMFSGSG